MQQSGDTAANTDGGDQYTGLDRFGRIIDQNWVNTSTGVSTDRFQYGYDRVGNVLYKNNLVNSSFSELYHANSATTGDNNAAYDPLNRLTGFSRGTLSSSGNNGTALDTVASSTHSQSWSLDQLGNWNSVTTDGTAQSRTTNAKNEVTAAGTSGLTFDNNGNTTTDDQSHTLAYDAWNRLVSVKNGSTTLATYAYDAQGRRITEAHGSTPTDLYYSNQWQVLEERAGGVTTKQYVWGIGYVDDLVVRDDNSVNGSLGKSGSGLGQRLYAQHDVNYNVTALVGADALVKERFVYDAYGAQTVVSAAWATTADGYSWIYSHQTGRLDVLTALYSFRNRDYSAGLGRWLQQDPAGYPDGASTYQFVRTNPVGLTDAWGEVAPPAHRYNPHDPGDIAARNHTAAVAATEQLFWDWLLGGGNRNPNFGPESVLTKELAKGAGAQKARDDAAAKLRQNCCQKNAGSGPLTGTGGYSPPIIRYVADYLFNVPTGGLFTNPITTFVGGFSFSWRATAINCKGRSARVHFTAFNPSTLHSASRVPKTDIGLLPNNPFGPNGPLGTTTQTFDWDEDVSW